MAGLCEGGNEPPGSLKTSTPVEYRLARLEAKPGGPASNPGKELRRADRIPGRVQKFQPRCANAYNGCPEIFPAQHVLQHFQPF
ncbi:hypothetical protein ANN_03624 [Periplaneta americana]|uniref:Uncharacterized protein n=1 Tax=Periplaneta americana TaxID=6978 RepID=A0ABQ8U0N9_PERAM|nr:hypothetical protein ANN_03624 [Periplaneta americana]